MLGYINSEEKKMKRKILTFPFLLLIAGLLLGACGGGGATDGSTSKPGDDQPAAGGDLSLDPANATSENASLQPDIYMKVWWR